MIDYRERKIRINGYYIYFDEGTQNRAENPAKDLSETAFE